MNVVFAILAPLCVLLVGYTLYPILGALLFSYPLLFIIRPVSKFWAYMISRYGGFVIETMLFGMALQWVVTRLDFVSWPAWIAFAWITFISFNTLFQFDVMCSRTQSGAWSPTMQ
jgi:hypothetical protein